MSRANNKIIKNVFGHLVKKIEHIIVDEIGSSKIIEIRQDPRLLDTWIILNQRKVAVIIRVHDDSVVEAIDTFYLESHQKSLKDLKSGALKFFI